MRILVMGAGALGGYFGARLLEAGRDVTFLVRSQRAEKLKSGLIVKSPVGDIRLGEPPLATAETLKPPFDLVLLSCKAFDLESAMDAMAPAIGPTTTILPLLNGMSHMDALNARFGKERVLGGWCAISATLNEQGEVLHLQPFHGLSLGEQDGGSSDRLVAMKRTLSGAKFDVLAVDSIILEMWEKWLFIAAAAGVTCLMRGTVGDILAADPGLPAKFLDECVSIAVSCGFRPGASALERFRTILTTRGSPFTASMLRDIEAGLRVEADHIIGDLLKRGERAGQSAPLLGLAYAHVKTYGARRARETQRPATQ
jgi:2-dehydropantoate 2-reductase